MNIAEFEKVTICGVDFTDITLEEFHDFVTNSSVDNSTRIVVTPNVDFIIRADSDEEFRTIINKADVSVCDSAVVLNSSWIVKRRLKAKITGFDAMSILLKEAQKNQEAIYLMGSTSENIKAAAENIRKTHPGLVIGGVSDGFFDTKTESEERVRLINESNAKYLFIGMGSPRQEMWAYQNKNALNVRYILSIGGLFDIYSGKTKRAPMLLQIIGMEWFWRMLCEPKRLWRRYLVEDMRYFRLLFRDMKKRTSANKEK